jgi:hypothetical protein
LVETPLLFSVFFVIFLHNVDGEEVDFKGMVGTLGTAIIMTPLIAILECIALSKAFGTYCLVSWYLV